MNQVIASFFKARKGEIEALAQELFQCPETAETEFRSMGAVSAYLEGHGFQIESGAGGMETAFRAVRGSGRPIIGFLGEYDALPNLNQQPVPFPQGEPGLPGHGCGHNLLGSAAAAAAAALADALEAEGRTGTVVYYGCPAEEILKGKIVMLKNGCFQELDAALSWHPGMENNCGELAYLAMDSVQFFFEGKASHASAAPDRGRSALDACELMNVGANYLREHVPDDVRIHYAHLPREATPNVVPAKSAVWYFVRARDRATVDDVTGRLEDIARGAALMTSTQVKWKFLSRGCGTLVNMRMCGLVHRVMTELGPPLFTREEKEFVRQLSVHTPGQTPELWLDETVTPMRGSITYMSGSTDVSDVSRAVPTAYFRAVCGPKGSALHSWQYAACAGHSTGMTGMLFAARVLAECGWRLSTQQPLLDAVRKEFEEKSTQTDPAN